MFNFDRFKECCIRKGVKIGYIESRLGLYHGFFNNVRAGKNSISEHLLAKVAILLDTTPDYLTGQTNDFRVPLNDRTGVKIGVFGDVAAGIPIEQIENFDPEDPDSWEEINRWTAKNGTYFALKIKGDSMEPRFLEGDVVIVRCQPIVESGEIAVVAINGNTATCKKVVWDENNGMFLIALNQKYPPRYFSSDEIRSKPVTILGKVVELRGKF